MLQVFYLNVEYVCNGFRVFSGVLQVFQTYAASVLAILAICYKCFHLQVVKIDLVLHMLQWDPPVVAAYYNC